MVDAVSDYDAELRDRTLSTLERVGEGFVGLVSRVETMDRAVRDHRDASDIAHRRTQDAVTTMGKDMVAIVTEAKGEHGKTIAAQEALADRVAALEKAISGASEREASERRWAFIERVVLALLGALGGYLGHGVATSHTDAPAPTSPEAIHASP